MDATTIEKSRLLGGNAADAYSEEFGQSPSDDGVRAVGDWDSSAWGLHWQELKDAGASEADHEAHLAAWRAGFWV